MGKDKKAKKEKKAGKPNKAAAQASAAAPPSPKGKGGTDVRKAAEQLVELAKSPAVRELAIAALGAAAAKIAESTEARREARAKRPEPGEGGDEADQVRGQAIHLGEAIRAAALEGARQLIDEFERGAAGAGKAKKRGAKKGATDPEPGEAR